MSHKPGFVWAKPKTIYYKLVLQFLTKLFWQNSFISSSLFLTIPLDMNWNFATLIHRQTRTPLRSHGICLPLLSSPRTPAKSCCRPVNILVAEKGHPSSLSFRTPTKNSILYSMTSPSHHSRTCSTSTRESNPTHSLSTPEVNLWSQISDGMELSFSLKCVTEGPLLAQMSPPFLFGLVDTKKWEPCVFSTTELYILRRECFSFVTRHIWNPCYFCANRKCNMLCKYLKKVQIPQLHVQWHCVHIETSKLNNPTEWNVTLSRIDRSSTLSDSRNYNLQAKTQAKERNAAFPNVDVLFSVFVWFPDLQ